MSRMLARFADMTGWLICGYLWPEQNLAVSLRGLSGGHKEAH
jgi:hypothetical protein